MSAALTERLDPRCALVCALLLSVLLASLRGIASSAVGLCLSLPLLFLAGIPFGQILKRLCAVNLFIAFIWLVAPAATPGDIVFQWHFVAISRQGLLLALLATLKCNAIICVFLGLLAPMPPMRMAGALQALKMPDKLVWMFVLMDRNIAILGSQLRKLQTAAKLRGFRAGANLNTYKTIAAMLAILLLRAHDHGRSLREAMLLRGFTGKLPPPPAMRSGGMDYCLFILTGLEITILIHLEPGLLHV